MSDAVAWPGPGAGAQLIAAMRGQASPAPMTQGDGRAAGPSRELASAFEAAFLAEMLKQTGLTRSLGSMAGGAGETGFSDLLTREIAIEIARSRPLGIAQALGRRFESGE